MSPSLPVLTAVTGRWETALAVGLDAPGSGVEVVRRCADLGELLSAAAAGLARAVVLSADLQRLDRDAVSQLLMARVAVVGLVHPGDGAARVRLQQLGIGQVLPADAPPGEIAQAVTTAVRELSENGRGSGGLGGLGGLGGWNGSGDLALLPGPDEVHGLPGRSDPGDQADSAGLADPSDPNGPDGLGGAGGSAGALLEQPLGGPRLTRVPIVRSDPGDALPALPRFPSGNATGTRPAPSRHGRLIAVWGPVGAPGRTTVAVTLAAELAALGRDCLLVDADTYGASIAQTLGLLDESAGLAAAARAANQGQLDLERLGSLAPLVTDRLRVLTGLPQPRRWTELRPSALDVVWEHARRLADCTVVDAGFGLDADEELMYDTAAPRRNGATLSALTAADLVIAVGAGDPIGLQRLLASLPDLTSFTGSAIPVQVVVTKVRDQAIGGAAADRVRGALDRYAGIADPVLVPDDRPALDAAMLAGRTLTELAPSSPARGAIAALARQLIEPGQVLDDGRGAVPARPRARSSRPGWRLPMGRWRETSGARTRR